MKQRAKEEKPFGKKMIDLHGHIKRDITLLKLHEASDPSQLVSSIEPSDHADQRVRYMSVAYGRRDADLKNYRPEASLREFMTLQYIIRLKDVGVALVVGSAKGSEEDREYILHQMNFPEYREAFLKLLQSLGGGYSIEVAGEKKSRGYISECRCIVGIYQR